MSESKISYTNRSFEDYRNALIDFTKQYYPDIAANLDDASIGQWMIDLAASIGDNLSFYIDKAYNETNIDSATLRNSVYSLARSNGFRIPGPKGAMTELKFTCNLPVSTNYPNGASTYGMPSFYFAPIIKKGTRVKTGNNIFFETNEDIDFSEQFDENGVSNREIIPVTESNGKINYYKVTKTCTATAGISKIFKMAIPANTVKPFMEIVIPDENVIEIESVIFKDGVNFKTDPSFNEFYTNEEVYNGNVYRFFEVDSLAQPYRWGDDTNGTDQPVTTTYGWFNADANSYVPTNTVTKGQWMPITQKFITEYTNNGYLKMIFGSGEQVGATETIYSETDYSAYRISKMIKNNFLGKLPKAGSLMYVLYRVGGGMVSNVAKGTINAISKLDAETKNCPTTKADSTLASQILSSITVTNTIPSVSGKDAPTPEEIKAMIKYNNSAQERCVTLKDYESRVLAMPSRYGCPFRVGAIEENNKIMLYLLGINHLGQLTAVLPECTIKNIINYLSMYRTINDYVEIKSGRVINLSFEVDLYIDKAYKPSDVINTVISKIRSYMDINKHKLGDDIYVSDLQKEIVKVDGVLNIIDMRIYNEHGENYSSTRISQITKNFTNEYGEVVETDPDRDEIDLQASDYILNSEADEMFEIKNDTDIKIRVKQR